MDDGLWWHQEVAADMMEMRGAEDAAPTNNFNHSILELN